MFATPRPGIRFSRAAAGAGLTVALAACDAPLSALDPAGPAAARIAMAWWVMLSGSALIFAFVMTLALYAFKAGRERHVPERAMLWGGGLAFPVVVLTALLIFGLRDGEALLPPSGARQAYTVEATGRQWQWTFLHPDGTTLTNEMHIPAGRPVDVIVRSEDVIHSFWAPRLGGKIDAIPGRANVIRLRADASGVYPGQCAEFCGLFHTDMRFAVHAHAPEALAAALAESAAETAP